MQPKLFPILLSLSVFFSPIRKDVPARPDVFIIERALRVDTDDVTLLSSLMFAHGRQRRIFNYRENYSRGLLAAFADSPDIGTPTSKI